jgi:hypothetical protein
MVGCAHATDAQFCAELERGADRSTDPQPVVHYDAERSFDVALEPDPRYRVIV